MISECSFHCIIGGVVVGVVLLVSRGCAPVGTQSESGKTQRTNSELK